MPPPALPPQAPRPSPPPPPDAAFDADAAPPPAAGWSDCPRCGEHWAPASPYCDNCGWVPGSAVADAPEATLDELPAEQPASPGLKPGTAAALAGMAAAAAVVAVWIGVGRTSTPGPATPPTARIHAKEAAAAASVNATPVATPATAAATAAASATLPPPTAASPQPASPAAAAAAAPAASDHMAATKPAAASATATGQGTAQRQELERFARAWLAEEAGASADQLDRLRPLYAERLDYRGRPDADWAVVAADKSNYLRRWPQRQYRLLALSVQQPADDGSLRVALQVGWQLGNQGRWRRGVSVTVLSLRRTNGVWRIVGEAGG